VKNTVPLRRLLGAGAALERLAAKTWILSGSGGPPDVKAPERCDRRSFKRARTDDRDLDVSALRARVATKSPSAMAANHAGRIQQFADATGDSSRIHLDVERAGKESPFKATIAHGS